MELPRAVSLACSPSNTSTDESTLNENQERTENGVNEGNANVSHYQGRPRHKVHDPARDLSIQVLEKFSLVTKFARETTSQLFRENQNDGFGVIERRTQNEVLLDHPKKSPNNAGKVPNEIVVASDPLEVALCFDTEIVYFRVLPIERKLLHISSTDFWTRPLMHALKAFAALIHYFKTVSLYAS